MHSGYDKHKIHITIIKIIPSSVTKYIVTTETLKTRHLQSKGNCLEELPEKALWY